MTELKQANLILPFNIGDRVKIKNYYGRIGRVVEYRGALGPDGALVFRVLVQRKPTPAYIELLANQLVAAPPAGTVDRIKGRKVVPKSSKTR